MLSAAKILMFATMIGILVMPISAQKLGTIEMGLFGGGTFDLPSAATSVGVCVVNTTNCGLKYEPGSKVFALAGLGLTLPIYKWVSLYGDYSYVFKDKSAASVTFLGVNDSATAVRQYSLVVGGVQVSLPSVQRFSPYVEIGGGQLYQSYNNYETITNLNGKNYAFYDTAAGKPVAGGLPIIHYGGGVRYFVGERWGLKFAVNGYKTFKGLDQVVPTTDPLFPATVTRRGFGDVTGGLFFRFGRR